MGSQDELKEIYVKNCTCYFDDLMRVRDRDIEFSDIVLGKKIYKEK